MLYLFCSAAAPLYKRDALESISYPEGHIFRYRYARKYIHADILDNLKCYKGANALLVFLDTIGAQGSMEFAFYPLRNVTILRIESTAGAIYLDFRFGEFVHYGCKEDRREAWDGYFKKLELRPWPPSVKSGHPSEGYFVFSEKDEPPGLETRCVRSYDNWNSVVNQLDRTKDLGRSTFCLILGFYQVKSKHWFGEIAESRLESTNHGFDSIYPIPMGKSVVLKVLLSRPSFNYDDPASVRTLKISAAGDTFSGMSKNKILSESRYNEDRTILVCKRLFDTALATVSIEEPDAKEIRSPKLTLLTRVHVPRFVIGTVILCVALGALFLALDAEVVKFLSALLPEFAAAWVDAQAKAIASVFKLLAPLPVALAAYIAFRRLPIK